MKSIYSTRSQIANGVYTTRHFKDKLLKIQTLVSYNGKQINVDELVSSGNLNEVTTELGNAINEHSSKLTDISDNLNQFNDRITSLEATKILHESMINENTNLVNNNKEAIEILVEDIKEITTSIEEQEQEINSSMETINNFTNKVETIETNITTNSNNITSLETRMNDAEKVTKNNITQSITSNSTTNNDKLETYSVTLGSNTTISNWLPKINDVVVNNGTAINELLNRVKLIESGSGISAIVDFDSRISTNETNIETLNTELTNYIHKTNSTYAFRLFKATKNDYGLYAYDSEVQTGKTIKQIETLKNTYTLSLIEFLKELQNLHFTTLSYQWRYYLDGNEVKREYNLDHNKVSIEDYLLNFAFNILATLGDWFNGNCSVFMTGETSK